MCGRFAQATALEKLRELTEISHQLHLPARYNIAPSSQVAIVRQSHNGQLECTSMKWGLVPHWARDDAIGHKLINAKMETLLEKPSFRGPFRYRRCAIPVDGFYEWTTENKAKQPWFIRMDNDQPMLLAGLWDLWETPEQNLESFTIITRPADSQIQPIHSRMPVLLKMNELSVWLSRENQKPDSLFPIMESTPTLISYKVNTLVNSPRNDDKTLIEPLYEGKTFKLI